MTGAAPVQDGFTGDEQFFIAFAQSRALKATDGFLRRQVMKKAAACFSLLPPGTPEFDHLTPADWLFDLYTQEDLDEMIAAQEKSLDAVGFESGSVQ